MDSGKNTREYRTIQGKTSVIVDSLAANTDPAQFSQKLYEAELVSQHVMESARVVGILTPAQRIQPLMSAVQSSIQLRSSKYSDFIDIVRAVYPALADVLNEYYVNSLEINVVDAVMDVSDWAELGCQIDVDLGKLHELQQSGQSPDRCRKELLLFWVKKDKRASWTKLSQALERMGEVKMTRVIKEKYCQPSIQDEREGETDDEEDSTDEEIDDIENDAISMQIEEFEMKFEDLAYRARVAIEEHTPIKKLTHSLQLLPLSIRDDHLQFVESSLPNIEKAGSVDEIFRYLNLYWNFIDYHLLEHLIKRYGNKSLKAKMGKYVRDLAEFRSKTTIAQVCGLAKVWSARADLPQHFSRLSTKFNKKASEYTLEELEQFRRAFCREFSLKDAVAMLAGATDGSVIVFWHVPSSVVSNLTAAILGHPHGFFEHHLLIEIDLDGICVYNAQQTFSNSPRSEGEVTNAESVGVLSKSSSLSLELPPLDEDEEELLEACKNGRLEEVTRLIQKGVNVNIIKLSEDDPDTPLMMASWNGDMEIVRCLLSSGAHVNLQGYDRFTALMMASKAGHHHVVLELLKAEADVNVQTKNGDTSLMEAANEGHVSIARDLLQAKADPNIQNVDKATALTFAAQNGHDAIVHELLTAGADPDLQTEHGQTALTIASAKGHESIVCHLLKSGADPHVQTKKGNTALMLASDRGHTSTVEALLKAGADPNIQTEGGETALFRASLKGYTEIVQELLKAKANVNLLNKDGLTPLLAATQGNHTEIVQKLLDAGAEINIAEKNTGWTALFFAAKVGEVEMIQLLLQKGADLRHVDRENVTAMDVAQAHGQERVYQILQESQRSCVSEQHTEETNIGGIDSSPVEQQTEDTDVEATDKPPVEHLTEETNIGGTNKSPQSDHRQQVLKERVLRVSNYFRTLFKQLEENLLSSRTKKARAIEDFQSVHSPQSQSSKRVKKGKKQSVKKTANTGEVNI